MAPLSRLLVYYVKSDGEGVADSISIPVKPVLKNKVSSLPFYLFLSLSLSLTPSSTLAHHQRLFKTTRFQQVTITSSRSSASPGSDVTVGLRGNKGSCACLALVDSSVHLMRPDYFLSAEKVICD